MRWENGRRSSNIEDQRGRRIVKGIKGGGIVIILLALIGMYFGIDPSVILNLGDQFQGQQTTSSGYTPSAEENRLADFV
ncbi:MAG: neutral zinc metallopeptidase, partial [Desulfobulbales bacterium]